MTVTLLGRICYEVRKPNSRTVRSYEKRKTEKEPTFSIQSKDDV
jgi:hypothetical protein